MFWNSLNLCRIMLILMKFITGNGWGSEGKARVWMLDRKHLDWFVFLFAMFPFMFLHSKGEKIYDWMFEMVVEWIVLPVLSDTHYSVVIFTSTHPSVIGRVNWDFWFGSLVLAKYELTGQLRAEAATANSTWLLWPAIFCILCDVHCWWISTWLVCTFKKKKSQCSFGPFLIYLCKVGVEAGERFQCAWNRY